MSKHRISLNLIISLVIVIAVAVFAAVLGDYYFDLNDDVLMKDILSGAFTGVPEGHNIQMLYPISAFISLFYRVINALDWYGIFLCGIQFGCFFLVIYKTLDTISSQKVRITAVVAETLLFAGFFLPHVLFVQYTVVCGLLSSTAAFLILVAKEDSKKDNILAVIMILVAYLIRSEMLLLTLPMVMVAVLIRFCIAVQESEEGISWKKSFTKYLVLCISIVCGIVLCTLAHKLAYSSPEWKEFNSFFDNRTELYDFQSIPDYDTYSEFYESIGLSKSSQQLLINYNFGLDDSIDSEMLGKIAQYAASLRGEEKPLLERATAALKLYFYRLRNVAFPVSYEYPMTDFPWNYAVVALYIAAFFLFLCTSKINILLLITLFACRSSLWMYIIMRGRDPIRITHPLYLIEILILMAVLVRGSKDNNRYDNAKYLMTGSVLLALLGASVLPSQLKVISVENTKRAEMSQNYAMLYDYFEENHDSYYLMDVYTSVSYAAVKGTDVATFSEKMFESVDNSFANHDLMGGWASKSPLVDKKLKRIGYTSMEKALLEENVFFVQNKTEDIEWLKAYYAQKGMDILVEKKDLVADIFAVYRVAPVDKEG